MSFDRSTEQTVLKRQMSSDFHALDENIAKIESFYMGSANAVQSALETFKVFKPEIARLDGRAEVLERGVEALGPVIQSIKVSLGLYPKIVSIRGFPYILTI